MKKCILCLLSIIHHLNLFTQSPCNSSSPFQVLHYTETATNNNGFDHNTRDVSAQMFRDLGAANGFEVTDTESSEIFNDISDLMQFRVVIWSNTSGNNLLTPEQEDNMEAYIAQGGSFIGIHAATDTYRNGSWSFYNDLVGAIVQTGPNHTSQNYSGTMSQDEPGHPTLDGIPDPWSKVEEYYYWNEGNGGQLSNNITSLLTVATTGDEVFDSARAITWYQELPSGGRSFYTALGHARSNYTSTSSPFRTLLGNAVCWSAANALLPIQLIQFVAAESQYGNQIRVTIENEGIEHLFLERSIDGETYVQIETFLIEEGINELVHMDEELTDEAQHFYRLRWQELDGTEQYSTIAVVENNRLLDGVSILGNPVRDALIFSVDNVNPGESFWVLDAFGRLVKTATLLSKNQVQVDEWGSGTYFLHIGAPSSTAIRFLVLRQ